MHTYMHTYMHTWNYAIVVKFLITIQMNEMGIWCAAWTLKQG